MMLDILCIGNANMDLYPDKGNFPGGSANNFAVACSKLGLKTGFLGFVGNDAYGRELINNLKRNNVKSYAKIVNAKTGTVKVLSKGFKKNFVKFSGANDYLKKLDLSKYLKLARHIHLATPTIELLKQSRNCLSLSIDPGSRLIKHSIKKLKPYLMNVKLFFATESEAEKITGKKYREACKELLKAGVKVAIIKRKSRGVYLKTVNEEFNTPYINEKVVDATGSGDAFASAFVSAMLKGKDLKEAVKWGMASNLVKIQKLGAQNTPNSSELIKTLEIIKIK